VKKKKAASALGVALKKVSCIYGWRLSVLQLYAMRWKWSEHEVDGKAISGTFITLTIAYKYCYYASVFLEIGEFYVDTV
jgi:hypothetical protein